MKRPILLTLTVLLFAAPVAEAGPLGLFGVRPERPAAANPVAPTYPRLAKVALASGPNWAPGAPPPLRDGGFRDAPVAQTLRVTWVAFSYIGAPFTAIGTAVPPGIRATHVLANGSPYAGMPVRTVLWVANPLAAKTVDWIETRRGAPLLSGRRR